MAAMAAAAIDTVQLEFAASVPVQLVPVMMKLPAFAPVKRPIRVAPPFTVYIGK